MKGKYNLTEGQIKYLIPVAMGLGNKEIAILKFRAVKTVKFNLGHIFKKMRITKRGQLIWRFPLPVMQDLYVYMDQLYPDMLSPESPLSRPLEKENQDSGDVLKLPKSKFNLSI